jgi:hypothetical protein
MYPNTKNVRFNYYTGQPVYIDSILTGQAVPFSIAQLMAGQTGAGVIQNILTARANASSQVFNPQDQAAIAEKQAYWERWIQYPQWWLPESAQVNFSSSNIYVFNLTTSSAAFIPYGQSRFMSLTCISSVSS